LVILKNKKGIASMTFQRKLLPSTSMLMAFDAAARTGSFTDAAQELSLTQGAISRQIQALEAQLNIELFSRNKRSIQLTSKGQVYAKEVNQALQLILNASLNAITSPLSGTLNLAILPTFGTRWLIPKFTDFLEKHPDITVNFISKLTPFDFHSENLHLAIHYGSPDWPNTQSTFLMGEESIPVCSPKLLEKHPLNNINDLQNLPLLHLATRPNAWQDWFLQHQAIPPSGQGMLFEQVSIIAKAATAELGVALLPKFLIQSELDKKELVPALDLPVTSSFGYYLVTPNEQLTYPPVVAFTQWLLTIAKS
jgi:DNA-binding transcriptional LysR family regulator